MSNNGVISLTYLVNNDSFNSKIADMKKNLQLLQTEVKNSAKEIDIYGSNIQNLAKKQDTIKQAIKQTEKIMDSYNKQLEKNKTALSNNQSELDNLASKKKELNSQYKQAIKMYGAESEEAQKLKEELRQVTSEYDKMKGKVEANKSNIQNYTAQLERQRTTLLDLQGQLKQTNEEIEKQGNKFTEASQKFADYAGKLEKAGGKLEEVGEVAMTAGTAILTAATGLATMAISTEQSLAVLEGQLGLTSEETGRLKEIAMSLYENGFGESIDDCINDVVLLQQNLRDVGNVTDEEKEKLLEYINNIKTLFGADTTDITKALNNMMNNGVISSYAEGLDLITVGFQNGLNSAGDMLDVLYEYSPQFKKLGLSGQDALEMIKAGLDAGGYNADKMADSLKELSIRAIDGSETTKEGFELIGLNADEMAKKFAAGGDTAKEALKQVLDGLGKMEDPVKQDLAAVDLFGTQWEDSSKQAILAMGDIGDGLGEITGATEKAGEEINNSVGTQMETVMRRLKDSLSDMGKALLPAVEAVAEGIEDLTKFISKLNPEVVKSIAKFGAMALAFGAVTKATGGLVTGIAKGASGLSKFIKVMDKVKSVGGFAKALGSATTSTTGLASAMGTLSSVALPLVAVIGSLAVGIYAYHEYNDALTQSVTKSREEMSALEKVFADLTGTTTYSKKELEKMGIVYEDFSKDVSPEFQKAVESMRDKIHEFNMDLSLFGADNVWSDEETETLKNNFNTAVDESIKNIENRRDEVQKMWAETFVMDDGVIDEGEQKVIEYYNTQYNSSIDEVNKMKADVNELFRKMIEEGYTLTPEDEQMIREYFAKISEIELECLAGNEEEQLFAKNKFKSQVNGLDAEGASKLGKERKKELDNELTDIEAFYDTKMELLKKDIENTDGETKKALEKELADLENQKKQKVKAKQEEINAIYDEIVSGNENLKGVIDRFTLEVFSGEDKRSNDRLNKLKKENADMLSETETGTKKIYDSQLKGWKEVTTIVDESTGEITGVISTWVDENGMHMEKAEGYNEEFSESTKTLGENMVTEFNRMKSQIEQNSECYVDNSGQIVNSNGEVIGSISQVIDENGNLVTSVNDVNGNPIDIKDNTGEAIKNLDNTAKKVNELDGKTATVKVTLDKGNVESQIDWLARDREVRIKATGMGTFIKPEFKQEETGGSINESGIYNTQEAGLELIDTASPSQSAYSLASAARGELTYIPANSKVTNAAMTTLKMKSMINEEMKSMVNLYMAGFEKKIVSALKNNNGNGEFNVTMNNPHFENKESEQQNISNIKRIIKSMK